MKKSIGLNCLSDLAQTVIEKYYALTPDEPEGYELFMQNDKETDYVWCREGDSINYILQEITGVDEQIANDIQEYLSSANGGTGGYNADRNYEEDIYSSDAHYVLSGPDVSEITESWMSFCCDITSRSRFFSKHAESVLNTLFRDVHSLQSLNGTVIRELIPETDSRFIYRARIAQSQEDIENILLHPAQQLGPPPFKTAKAGRMNAEGIAVFYGAEDIETCIAEVRPPVGGTIVTGRFEVLRKLRLLDFDALSDTYVQGSFFDPDFRDHYARSVFFESLVQDLTKPVMLGDEVIKYLPTQIVAEFLAKKISPRLDGIVFTSTQTDNQGRNIVLFNHASVVEPYDLPKGYSASIDFGTPHGDYDDTIYISETMKEKGNQPEVINVIDSDLLFCSDSEGESETFIGYSLCLDVDSVAVHDIKGAKFTTSPRDIHRFRYKSDDNITTSDF